MKIIKATVFLLTVFACNEQKNKMTTGLEGKPMPMVEALLADSSSQFNTNNIPTGKPTILFSFEPWCMYSKAQTADIIENIKTLKDVNIYMLCSSSMEDLREFNNRYKLYKYPNIKAGVFKDYQFYRYFNTSNIPLIAIYDREKKLKNVIVGKTDVSSLKDDFAN